MRLHFTEYDGTQHGHMKQTRQGLQSTLVKEIVGVKIKVSTYMHMKVPRNKGTFLLKLTLPSTHITLTKLESFQYAHAEA